MAEHKVSFDSDVESHDENLTFLNHEMRAPRSWWRRCLPSANWAWKCSTFFFAFIAVQSLYYIHAHKHKHVNTGLSSELGMASDFANVSA
jgi:hypothetical protein